MINFKRTTSAAKSVSPAPERFESAPSVGAAFKRSHDAANTNLFERGSGMVKQDRPKPAPRPSPRLARGADAAVFQERWQAEKAAADRGTRKAEFIAKRKAQAAARPRTRTHSRSN
jgi:hypothetical protein